MATDAKNNTSLEYLQKDPVTHIEDIQGVTTIEPFQERVARVIAENDRVAIAACHDVGKTWLMAKIVLWFTSVFPNSKVITTAPTGNQVKRLLWSEIRAGYEASKVNLGGNMLQTEWQIRADWFAVGFTPRAERSGSDGQGTASRFQGFHAPYILIVFDEATGIDVSMFTQAEGMLTSGYVRFVCIGNPTSKASKFFQLFSNPLWTKVYLSCFDSPNLIANGITDKKALLQELRYLQCLTEVEMRQRLNSYKVVQTKLLTTKWVMEKAIEWGIDHPLFVSKVLGQFPEEDDYCLIPLGVVETAQYREPVPESQHDKIVIGVDVARFGFDKSIITVMRGVNVIERRVLTKKDTGFVTGELIGVIRALPWVTCVCIDGTGIGAGVVDQLKTAQEDKKISKHVEIREVHFGAGATESDDTDVERTVEVKKEQRKYANLKAKMFVLLSQDLKAEIKLLDDEVYLQELPTIIYRFNKKGAYQIESKDEYKKRTGLSSPDNADSLALANYGRYDNQHVGKMTEEHLPGSDGGSILGDMGDSW